MNHTGNTDIIRFEIELDANTFGWAELRVTGGDRRIRATCSNVIDSLGDLVRGFAAIVPDGGKFAVETDTEDQGGCLFTFRRVDEQIEVVAKRYLSSWDTDAATDKARHTKARFRAGGCFASTLASVVSAFASLLDMHGEEGYRRSWGREFPRAEFEHLRSACSQQ